MQTQEDALLLLFGFFVELAHDCGALAHVARFLIGSVTGEWRKCLPV